MMKHLQEPVPSVLEERSDLPASVGRVVARAMAKLPTNRYQNVAELVEDMTIASGMTIHRLAPVTTTAETPVRTRDDADEVTMVRPREEPPPQRPLRREPVMVPVMQEASPPAGPPSSFNPLKIVIPAVLALAVAFLAIFLFTRNSPATTGSNTNQPVPSLAADPNSQPVQPVQPPSGKAEQGLPAGGAITPAANVNASPNANEAISPLPAEDVSPPANANANSNANSNSNRKAPALPEPTRTVVPETSPSPVPSATKPPAEKPSPTPTP
jgi:hypothetical protein